MNRQLSAESLFVVGRSVRRFMREYEVRSYPLNCFRLLDTVREKKLIHLDILETRKLSAAFDAVAEYFPSVDSYVIVMKPVPEHWKDRSPDRRCNFTLAHELGHIFCGHLAIPFGAKSPEERLRDDLEADEFAGRLLMPAGLVSACRPKDRGALAEAFLVSEQAAARRLQSLGSPDIFRPFPGRTCPRCGLVSAPGAAFCAACGLEAGSISGVLPVPYPAVPAGETGRVLKCPLCGNGEFSENARYCRICGTPAFNTCADESCGRSCSPGARFCAACGSETAYARRGLLPEWKAVREAYIRRQLGKEDGK